MRTVGFVAALSIGLYGCQAVVLPPPVVDLSTVERQDTRDVPVLVVTRYDCGIVRWLLVGTYCGTIEPPVQPPEYCTRSLAQVDCWDRPNPFGYYQRQVADGPWQLSPEQELNRMGPWLVQ